jgi:succinate dehydrogenase/fumarate reductase flavoprotein subunit
MNKYEKICRKEKTFKREAQNDARMPAELQDAGENFQTLNTKCSKVIHDYFLASRDKNELQQTLNAARAENQPIGDLKSRMKTLGARVTETRHAKNVALKETYSLFIRPRGVPGQRASARALIFLSYVSRSITPRKVLL